MAIVITNKEKAVTDWDDYVYKCPKSTLYHLSAWRNVARKSLGVHDVSLDIREDNRIVGILPLFWVKGFFGRNYLTSGIFGSYEGIIADNESIGCELLQKTKEISWKNRCRFFVIKDYRKRNYSNLILSNDYVTFVIDLRDGIKKVWTGMKDKTRNQIRKAQKNNLSVMIDNSGLQDFFKVYAKNMRDVGSPCVGINFFRNLLIEFNDQAKVILVKLNRLTIGGGIMLTFKDTTYIPFASSLREYNTLCPNNMLYWEAIQYAFRKDYKYFDFGRSAINSGTFNFKKQWGGIPRQLYYYSYYLNEKMQPSTFNSNDKRYQKYIRLWRKLPVFMANFLGSKIIKSFV